MLAGVVLLAVLSTADPVTPQEMAGAVLYDARPHPAPLSGHVALATRASTLTHAVFGYYPSFTGDDFSEIRFDLLTHVGYFTGGCTASGGWSAGAWPYDALVQAAHARGTKVLLVIPCNGASIDAVIANKSAFIASVVAGLSHGEPADGVDLDFEGMSASHLADFPVFVAELEAAVRQVLPEAEFSAALPAVDWSSAYDYPKLAGILDHLVIMAYDYHWKGGDPGPVSPLDYAAGHWNGYHYDVQWSVADYTSAIADPSLDSKILMGLPWYGYDWPSTSFAIPGTKTANGAAKTYAAALQQLAGHDYAFDTPSQSAYFFYDAGATHHQMWFDDRASFAMKLDAAKGFGLGGVGIWALKYDTGHPELWQAISDAFVPGAPAPTPTETPSGIDVPPVVGLERPSAGAGGSGCDVGFGGGSAMLPALIALGALSFRRGSRHR